MLKQSALTLVLAVAAPFAALAGQDGGNPPGGGQPAPPTAPAQNTKDADAAAYLKDVKAQMDKQADVDAKIAIKKLIGIWKDKEVADETKKPIPDLLERYARADKTAVAIDAIEGLGELGAVAGAKPVLGILDRALKAKEPSVDVYGSCLRALKKLADPKPGTVKALEDLLKHRMDDVAGKAADAMSGYKEAPGKIRRELLEELIKGTEGLFSAAKDPKNGAQVRRWNIIQGNVVIALNALSGQAFKNPEEARKWFNDHKKDKSWDS